ncbi:MAG: histidine phosphatase family protein [Rhodoferax sp.]
MAQPHTWRRRVRCLFLAWGVGLGAVPVIAKDVWSSVTPGAVVLFRHALAPGGGDPAGFQLNDCATQRNLSVEGRAQARRIGEAFRRRGIAVGTVWTSQWCRTRETADLAFPGKRTDQVLFNSFFNTPEREPAQTRAALDLLASWRGSGVVVVVTHQVNITALTGIVPNSGEGVVLAPWGPGLKVLGRITP